jgi:hypothetical protein
VNGQADAFFAYGFENASVQGYEHRDGSMLRIEIWELATPADAYGLFTASVSGAPADIGNDGDVEPGRRLAFWQDRYFVYVRSRQEVDDADLRRFGQAASAVLPSGADRPPLVDRLPGEGLEKRSVIFFHEEISIQDQLWLGGKNLLGLNGDTDAVLARYDREGTTVRLLVVQYPNSQAASAALSALQKAYEGSSRESLEGLLAADSNDTLLAAVFGEAEATTVEDLVEQVLQ